MLEETELVKKLREIVWEADLCTTTAGIIRKKLEDHFGVDLSSKKQKRLINLPKERGIGNGTKSCFQNLKDPSKGKETERQSKKVEEEDATSKSKKAVEQHYRAKEDEAPTKMKEREKQPNNIGEVVPSQSKETVVQLISAGKEEIPSKPKKSKRERQDMEKSEKLRKKPKRTKVEEAPSKSKKPSKQPIQAEEEALLKTKEKESQPQTGTEGENSLLPQMIKNKKEQAVLFSILFLFLML